MLFYHVFYDCTIIICQIVNTSNKYIYIYTCIYIYTVKNKFVLINLLKRQVNLCIRIE